MDGFFDTTLGTAILIAAQSLLIVGFVMISLLFLVYGDRKVWAAVQMRRGPNVVGPWGILQSVADALKYVVKEIVIPAGVDRPVFFLAPMLSFVLAILAQPDRTRALEARWAILRRLFASARFPAASG